MSHLCSVRQMEFKIRNDPKSKIVWKTSLMLLITKIRKNRCLRSKKNLRKRRKRLWYLLLKVTLRLELDQLWLKNPKKRKKQKNLFSKQVKDIIRRGR